MENRNPSRFSPLVKAVTRTLSSTSSIRKASLLKWVTYDFRLSPSRCLMFSMAAEDRLYLYPSMKRVTKCPFNFLKVETVFGVSLLNHTLTGPFSLVGNALHIISSGAPCKCMRVLNDCRWSSGSLDPSYISTYGIRNFTRRRKDVTSAMKKESVRWTSSSKLVDIHPLIAFIIMSIFSFIIYISWAMRIALTSILERWLMSPGPSLLLGMLLSSWSSLSCLPPVGRWQPFYSLTSHLSCGPS